MVLRSFRSVVPLTRYYSTNCGFVNLVTNGKTGVATLTLNRPPVHSFNLPFLTELSNTFQELEKNKCTGLIVTSNSNSVFSAGLDINELYKPQIDRLKEFCSYLQDLWINMYTSSYPTVAVINGHAPAGGCMVALACEYRIMLNNFIIGLNESQVGIVAPKWLRKCMQNTIGKRQGELALTTSKLFQTEEAYKIGLIDEIAQNKDEALEKAEIFLRKFAKIPSHARALTKKSLRGVDIKYLVDHKKEEIEHFATIISAPEVQKAIGVSSNLSSLRFESLGPCCEELSMPLGFRDLVRCLHGKSFVSNRPRFGTPAWELISVHKQDRQPIKLQEI